MDFNAEHGVNGSKSVTELHLVAACVCLPLDVPHNQVGVAFSVFNDHIFGWVQRLLAIEPHNLRNGSTNIDDMEAQACASPSEVLFLQREAWVELRSSLQAQFATSLDLSSFIDGSAGVQAFVFLLICQDTEGVVAAIRAHLILATLDEFPAVTVPFDLRQGSSDNATSQGARLAKLGG